LALNSAALLICLPIIILLFAFERSSACNLFFRLHFLAGLGIIHTAAFIFIVDSSLLPKEAELAAYVELYLLATPAFDFFIASLKGICPAELVISGFFTITLLERESGARGAIGSLFSVVLEKGKIGKGFLLERLSLFSIVLEKGWPIAGFFSTVLEGPPVFAGVSDNLFSAVLEERGVNGNLFSVILEEVGINGNLFSIVLEDPPVFQTGPFFVGVIRGDAVVGINGNLFSVILEEIGVSRSLFSVVLEERGVNGNLFSVILEEIGVNRSLFSVLEEEFKGSLFSVTLEEVGFKGGLFFVTLEVKSPCALLSAVSFLFFNFQKKYPYFFLGCLIFCHMTLSSSSRPCKALLFNHCLLLFILYLSLKYFFHQRLSRIHLCLNFSGAAEEVLSPPASEVLPTVLPPKGALKRGFTGLLLFSLASTLYSEAALSLCPCRRGGNSLLVTLYLFLYLYKAAILSETVFSDGVVCLFFLI